jgi:hypothetical protein
VRRKYREKARRKYPVQLQLRYTRSDGTVCCRVLSRMLPVTTDRQVAVEGMNAAVVGLAAVQQCAALAQEGKVADAVELLHSVRRMMLRGALSDEQQEEFGNFVSQCQELDLALGAMVRQKRRKVNDSTTKLLFQRRHANINDFYAGSKKKEVVKQRKADKALTDMYYAYKF